MRKLRFGELELSILRLVRQQGRVTVRTIYQSLGEQGSYTTIMTVMSRMALKGELGREKEGKHYIYWACSPTSTAQSALKRLKEKIFGGKTCALVSYLLEEDQEISDQELAALEQMISQRKAGKLKHEMQ